MDQHTLLLIFFGFGIIIIAVIAIVAIRGQIQRVRDMAQLAQQLGFQFIAKGWRGPALSPQFKTLLHRSFGTYSSVMIGSTNGLPVSLFDFSYAQGKQRVTQTVACFTHTAPLPPFLLGPEGVLDRLADGLFHNDIDFPTNPEFSRRYVLQSPDEAAIRNFFTASLLAFFEQIPADQKWHVESTGTTILLYRRGNTVPVPNLTTFLNDTSTIANATSALV